jgi:hypothetical protein
MQEGEGERGRCREREEREDREESEERGKEEKREEVVNEILPVVPSARVLNPNSFATTGMEG